MPEKIVIVRKKKSGAQGHHGGSWKVAYADFVTAMMAFFLVMWIMGMDQGVRDMVQGYFQNPIGFRRTFSGGANILSQGNSIMSLQLQNAIILRRREEQQRLEEAAEDIEERLQQLGIIQDADARVEVVVTGEGLRIEMMELGGADSFFESSSAALKPAMVEVLTTVAGQIARLPNGVVIEGHTDAVPFPLQGYTNWELSTDRANAARRVLIAAGMPADHLNEVRGYADRHLKVPDLPEHPSNRRISLLLPYDTPDPGEGSEAAPGAATPGVGTAAGAGGDG